jgi:hypothetical protein
MSFDDPLTGEMGGVVATDINFNDMMTTLFGDSLLESHVDAFYVINTEFQHVMFSEP